jgi:DNA (cytosine-5)-methyltransferase 1
MIKVASFFAGIGGICYGFEQEGFNIIYANEYDEKACITYRANHSHILLEEKDIKTVETSNIPDFDVFTGGFPCQPYSLAGNKGGLADVRGTLFYDIVRILKDKSPQAFLLENVKNILSTNNGEDFKTICDHLHDCGYTIKYDVLSGNDHANIPQCRERMFIVGFSDDNKTKQFIFPNKIPLTTSIDDIVNREIKAPNKYYYTSKSKYYPMIQQAMTNKSIYQMRRVYMRENKSGVCPTLTANMGGGGHNVPLIVDNFGIRKLMPKECLGFQGFPSDFKIVTSDVHIYKQAGNAVIVPLIKRIASEIKKVL